MGAAVRYKKYRWPGGVIPYTMDSKLPDPDRVQQAIRHWEKNTVIRFVHKRQHDQNFVIFVEEEDPDEHCASKFGMVGGKQEIRLAKGCHPGIVAHEIGHAVGLFHEQQRHDRDNYVAIIKENIEEGRYDSNFRQYNKRGGMDVGYYDFGSIMHYSATAFGKRDKEGRRLVTLQPKYPPNPVIPNAKIGNRKRLSRGDINTVYYIYVAPQAFRPPRLQIGDQAMLGQHTKPNNVRLKPGLNHHTKRRQIHPGQKMDILDGPKYIDDYIWWKVRSDEARVKGWTAEAGEDGYWVVPLLSSG